MRAFREEKQTSPESRSSWRVLLFSENKEPPKVPRRFSLPCRKPKIEISVIRFSGAGAVQEDLLEQRPALKGGKTKAKACVFLEVWKIRGVPVLANFELQTCPSHLVRLYRAGVLNDVNLFLASRLTRANPRTAIAE